MHTTITEHINALNNKEALPELLVRELPDINAYNEYPEEKFDELLAAILKKFGEAGIEIFQAHDACILHGGGSGF